MDFERVRSYWTAKRGTWLALDFESWERENSLLLEVGWSLVRWDAEGKEVNEQVHLIVKERMQYQNGTYVQGNRDVSLIVICSACFGRWDKLILYRVNSITILARASRFRRVQSRTASGASSKKLVRQALCSSSSTTPVKT